MTEGTSTYPITDPPDPREIDTDRPQDAARVAVEAYVRLLVEVVGYAERVETAVLNSAWQDGLDLRGQIGPDAEKDPYGYAQLSAENNLGVQSAGALGVALAKAQRLQRLLDTPTLER